MCTKKRLVWVDLAKLVAIFAVMVDHACFLLYSGFWRDTLSVSTVVSSISCLWLKWIVYFSTMVFGSLAIEMGYKAMRSVFVKSHDLEKSVALAGLSG